MFVDFSMIELSKAEWALLEQIETKGLVFRRNVPDDVFRRLKNLGILESNRTVVISPDGSKRPDAIVEFGENGRNFVNYYRNKRRTREIEKWKYIVTTAIAVTALILSALSILWQIHTWRLNHAPNPSACTTAAEAQLVLRPQWPQQWKE